MTRRIDVFGSQLNIRISAENLSSAARYRQKNTPATYIWVGGFLPRSAEEFNRRRRPELANLLAHQTNSYEEPRSVRNLLIRLVGVYDVVYRERD